MKEVKNGKICYLVGAMKQNMPPVKDTGDMIIGVDGGYAQMKEWTLEPDWVVGDFDSLGYEPKEGNVTVLPVRKDETDMEYAMKLGLEQGYTRFILSGGLGGRFDHSFANIQLLHQLAKQGAMGILLGETESMTVLCQGEISFPEEFQGYFSVFALESEAVGVSLKNLSFEVEHVTLSPRVPIGVSNQFLQGKSAKIQVKKGAVLLIWQHETMDRHCRSLFSRFVTS